MTQQQFAGLKLAFTNLLPGCRTSEKFLSAEAFAAEYDIEVNSGRVGGRLLEEEVYVLWGQLADGRIGVIRLERPNYTFSKAEQEVLRHICSTAHTLVSSDELAVGYIASCYAFEHMLVSDFIREGLTEEHRVRTTSFVINLLQDLAFENYEGLSCRSGFVVAGDVDTYLEAVRDSPFEFNAFSEEIELYDDFFNKPASHRYVDGRDAFYLSDMKQNVFGVLRNSEPLRYSTVDRAAHEHLQSLLQAPVPVWAGYVGENQDVNIVLDDHLALRWLKAHWHFMDRGHLLRLLIEHGMTERRARELAAIIFAVADMRLGALILVTDDPDNRPTAIGHIDQTGLGEALYASLIGRQLIDLRERNAAVGMLTSDGLTTISKAGEVLGCGEIVSVESSKWDNRAGGGRTQAALAASEYGLSIKVSQDGPITIFRDQQRILQLMM